MKVTGLIKLITFKTWNVEHKAGYVIRLITFMPSTQSTKVTGLIKLITFKTQNAKRKAGYVIRLITFMLIT
jgi:hypothetical protein